MDQSRIVLSTAAVVALSCAPAASAQVGISLTPSCVKPGAQTTVQMLYSPVGPTQANRKQARSSLIPNTYQPAFSDKGGLLTKLEIFHPFAPVTYADEPSLPGTLRPSFTQVVTVPSTLKYQGQPVLSYSTRVEAFDATGTRSFGDDGRWGDLYVDVPRLIIDTKRVRRNGSLRALAVGYGANRKAYVHVLPLKGKRLRRISIPASQGKDCGRRALSISFRGAKRGSYRVVLNHSATSKSATGGSAVTVRVTR